MNTSTPGSPAWVDLGTADLEAAKRFYTNLFGWTAATSGDEYGGYTTFLLDSRAVAGAGPLYGDSQPTAWSTYFATDNANVLAARVEMAGGKVLMAPFDVMDQGRMAAFLDPAGAPFSVWQPGTMPGAEIFDSPGSLTWNELHTRDLAGAKAFYHEVFGWTYRDASMNGQPYLVWENHGETICGMQSMIDDEWSVDLPGHWLIYLAVRDCDISAQHTRSLGGRVLRAPTSVPIGRFAVVEDPQGGIFSIIAGR